VHIFLRIAQNSRRKRKIGGNMGIIGRHSFELCSRPRIISSASYVGDKEGKGPLRECFDKICRDDTLGLDSWEQAESRMFESAVIIPILPPIFLFSSAILSNSEENMHKIMLRF